VAEIQPFAGIRYALSDDDLGRVLAPPYDVISPEQQRALYARDSRNIVRCVLNATAGDAAYEEAAREFGRLRSEGILQADSGPCYYLLEQSFLVEGVQHVRWGLLARLRVEDYEEGHILPHEKTRKGPREDRYKLLVATRANFSPIFFMFDDAGAFLRLVSGSGKDLVARYTDDDSVLTNVYRIQDSEAQGAFTHLLASGKAYIADGHHRYATALRFRDAHGGAFTCGYFTPIGDDGLLVLPYHRIVREATLGEISKKLEGLFEWTALPGPRDLASAVCRSKAPYAFGFFDSEGAGLAESRAPFLAALPSDAPPSLRALDTFVLHQGVFGRLLQRGEEAVEYCHAFEEVVAGVEAGRGVGVLMRPTTVKQIVDVSEARESMPPKSTFFYPKIPSGLVIHPLP
jgi:uncharacterized protein (DUF1015 family)